MLTGLLSQTISPFTPDPFAYFILAVWALVVAPLTVVFVRALVRSSYPFGRKPSLYWRGKFGFLLPRRGFVSRTARALLVGILIVINLGWLNDAFSLLFPGLQVAEPVVTGVLTAVGVVLLLLALGALLLTGEPHHDKP